MSTIAARLKSWQVPRWARLGMKMASEVVPKLPERHDTWLQRVVKAIAVVDSIQTVLAPDKTGNPIRAFVERYDLEESKNEQLVRLFFDTKLYDTFTVNRFSPTEYVEIVDAVHPKLGRLAFVEYSYGDSGPEDTFYHSKGIDFAAMLGGLWDGYEGRLHVTIGPGPNGSGSRSEFAAFHACANPLFGSMQARMDGLVARHRRFATDKLPRSYMLYGPPGTGKSSFATAFADRLGSRTMKLDAASLSFAHVRDVTFLLETLRPDFLLIDDVDKADVSRGMPTLLDVLQRFKSEHQGVSVLMTANTIDRFDPGLLRPGRIDTWVEFPLPDAGERRALLERYAGELQLHVEAADVERLVEASDKLSHDYLRELALQLRYEEPARVAAAAELMRKLLDSAAAAAPVLLTQDGVATFAKVREVPPS